VVDAAAAVRVNGNAAGGGQRSTGADLAQMMSELPRARMADLVRPAMQVILLASEPY